MQYNNLPWLCIGTWATIRGLRYIANIYEQLLKYGRYSRVFIFRINYFCPMEDNNIMYGYSYNIFHLKLKEKYLQNRIEVIIINKYNFV